MTPRLRLLSIRVSEKLARYPNLVQNLGQVEIKEQAFCSPANNTVTNFKIYNYKKEKTV